MARRSFARLRFAWGVLLALLPSWIKIPLYRRLYGFRIGRGVRIGWSPFVGVRACTIQDHVSIGHGNLFLEIGELEVGAHAQIGFLNVVRGGDRVSIGSYASILRQNVMNAILEPDAVAPLHPVLELGCGVVVTTGHWLDFSDGITIGDHSIVGGRNSSLWTHNRQRGRAIVIGHHCYLGSEVRLAPGTNVAPLCVVALGAVLTGAHDESLMLIGGNPATPLRKLRESEYPLVVAKTRRDIPDELAAAQVPPELRHIPQTVECSAEERA